MFCSTTVLFTSEIWLPTWIRYNDFSFWFFLTFGTPRYRLQKSFPIISFFSRTLWEPFSEEVVLGVVYNIQLRTQPLDWVLLLANLRSNVFNDWAQLGDYNIISVAIVPLKSQNFLSTLSFRCWHVRKKILLNVKFIHFLLKRCSRAYRYFFNECWSVLGTTLRILVWWLLKSKQAKYDH